MDELPLPDTDILKAIERMAAHDGGRAAFRLVCVPAPGIDAYGAAAMVTPEGGGRRQVALEEGLVQRIGLYGHSVAREYGVAGVEIHWAPEQSPQVSRLDGGDAIVVETVSALIDNYVIRRANGVPVESLSYDRRSPRSPRGAGTVH